VLLNARGMNLAHAVRIFSISIVSLGLVACNGVADGGSGDGESGLRLPPINAFGRDHSFLAFESWGSGFTSNGGWGQADTPVLFGHVNADTKDDFVGFGNAGVWVGLSAGNHFASVAYVLAQFGTQQGWTAARNPRLVGDISHDGLDDVVGFGNDGVWTALSNGSGFAPARYVLADFGYNQGWRVETHARVLADVNGDHNKDIVAFGDAGVYVALADGAGGFRPASFVLAQFGTQQGWTAARHVRTLVDLNGDGFDDIVAFGDDGVWTALATGSGGFAAPHYVLADFGYNQGWRVGTNTRTFADLDGDGKKDIIGFGANATFTARSAGNGTFYGTTQLSTDCGASSHKSCVVADLNADGYGDLLAYGYKEWNQSLGQLGPLRAPERVLYGIAPERWTTADLDGNGMADVVAFTPNAVMVARSTDLAPARPPLTPYGLYFDLVSSSGLNLNWTQVNSGQTAFEIEHYQDANEVFETSVTGERTGAYFSGLDASTKYCFRVRAVNSFTYSDWTAWTCWTTDAATAPTTGTYSMFLNEDPPPVTGAITYSGRWTPQGRTITQFRSAYNLGDRILFVKKGYSPSDCYTNANATISLYSNGTMTAAQVSQVSWVNSDGTIDFYGCYGAVQGSQTIPTSLVFNIDWQQ
jgi:hypothetical protein